MKDIKDYKPESLMMSHGYKPELSEGAIKPPIFMTSTFVFKSAEEGKAFFEVAYGLREKEADENLGLIYSRINNPNLEIVENRLSLWGNCDDSAIFESGMSAITTVLLEFLKPGDLLLYSSPNYGGTDHFIHHFLDKIGVHTVCFDAKDSKEEVIEKINQTGKADKLTHIFVETPANPTNALIDIAMCKEIANEFSAINGEEIIFTVDNTYMGPIWSNPMELGADLVVYSATKYIGGHSDLIAGAVLANQDLMIRVKTLRTFLGNMANPHTCWLLSRSLETLMIRMEKQQSNAIEVANFLSTHPKVKELFYLGNLDKNSKTYEIYKKQYNSPGAMISFEVEGGEKEAFTFLNNLKVIKLAVSLGSTESLAQHPASMTHIGLAPEDKVKFGITPSLVRLSVGVENAQDLIEEIGLALEAIQ